MGSRPERGAYGNARGKPDKQRRNRENRKNDPRYQKAMEEVRKHNQMIDELAIQTARKLETTKASGPILVYERPVVSTPKPAESITPAVRATEGTPRRYVDCHCGHAHNYHMTSTYPSCSISNCACTRYRPSTAPDTGLPKLSGIRALIHTAKNSNSKRTVSLANKIEEMIAALQERVMTEEEEREVKARELARTREARERIARLERELREAREALSGVKSGTTSVKRQTISLERGEYYCPELDCLRHAKPFLTAQALGAHRARSHGYRRNKT